MSKGGFLDHGSRTGPGRREGGRVSAPAPSPISIRGRVVGSPVLLGLEAPRRGTRKGSPECPSQTKVGSFSDAVSLTRHPHPSGPVPSPTRLGTRTSGDLGDVGYLVAPKEFSWHL